MKKISKKRVAIIVIALLVVAGAAVFWRHEHPPRSKRQQPLITKDSSSNQSKTVAPKNSSQGEGGVTDKNGVSAGSSSSSKPVSSPSGLIALEQPAKNATIATGDAISGSAKVDTIQFRLIDNDVGVIAQGQLKVVDGKFSGILHFQNRAASGRLDVFSLDPASGAEANEVQIAVNFK